MPLTVAAFTAMILTSSASWAQNSNSARVINQSQTGLGRPSGSYIGPGTVSGSARGDYGAGAQVNAALPRVNMGASVATPGDNMYGPAPTQVRQTVQNQSLYYKNAQSQSAAGANPNLPAVKLGANVGIAGDAMRSDMNGPNQPRKAPPTTMYTRGVIQAPVYHQQPQQSLNVGSYADSTPVKQEIHF